MDRRNNVAINDGDSCCSERTPLLDVGNIPSKTSRNHACAVPARWSLTILAFFGFFCLYALRFNLSVAIVAMAGNVTDESGANVTVSHKHACTFYAAFIQLSTTLLTFLVVTIFLSIFNRSGAWICLDENRARCGIWFLSSSNKGTPNTCSSAA